MEERNLKINFFKSGSGSMNAKANLPVTWLRKIGITPEERNFKLKLNEETGQLIIEKDN